MKEITEHIFLGDSKDAEKFIEYDPSKKEWLNPNKIVAVVNCTSMLMYHDDMKEVENYCEGERRRSLGIPFDVRYLFLNIRSTSRITKEMAADIIAFIDDNVKRGNVLVHCFAGLQRSPSAILVYLLSKGVPFMKGLHLIEERKGDSIYPTTPMLQSIAKLKVDGKTVHDNEINRFTNKYRY